MIDYIDRYVVAGVVPYLKAPITAGGLGLSDTQCGLLMSVIYWSMIVLTFPFSILIDRWKRTKSLGIMVFLWSLATGAGAFVKSFPQLFAVRLGVGVGEAGYSPGGYSLISAYFPQKKRELVIGIWNAAIPLGIVGGTILGGIIGVHLGWRHAFGIVAIPGIILAFLFLAMKDYKTVRLVRSVTQTGSPQTVPMKIVDVAKGFLKTPSLLLTYVGYAGNVFVTNALLFWLPSYFNRTEGLPMDKASLKSSAIFVLAIVGAPLGGLLTNMLQKKVKNARLSFPALSCLVSAILLFVAFYVFEGRLQYYVLIAVGLTIPMFIAGSAAVTQDVVHPGLRSISFSLCMVVHNLLGGSLGPIFVGFISDGYSDPMIGLTAGLKYLPFFLAIGAAFFFAGSFFYVRDLAKAERVVLEPEK
jgi:MFS family permease